MQRRTEHFYPGHTPCSKFKAAARFYRAVEIPLGSQVSVFRRSYLKGDTPRGKPAAHCIPCELLCSVCVLLLSGASICHISLSAALCSATHCLPLLLSDALSAVLQCRLLGVFFICLLSSSVISQSVISAPWSRMFGWPLWWQTCRFLYAPTSSCQ